MEFLILTFAAVFLSSKNDRYMMLCMYMSLIIASSMIALELVPKSFWYQTCAIAEALIIVGCIAWRPHAAQPVAALSIMAIVWHYAAFIEYSSGLYSNEQLGPVVTQYRQWLPLIQYGQVASLFLFSPPSLRFIDGRTSAMIRGAFKLIKRARQKPEKGTWQPTSSR